MADLKRTHLDIVEAKFEQWIEPLNFPSQLRDYLDFEYIHSKPSPSADFYSSEGLSEEVPYNPTIQPDLRAKIAAGFIGQLADTYCGRKQYSEELTSLIAEVKDNTLNVPRGDNRRPGYQQELRDLHWRMNRQVAELNARWEDDNNELSSTRFRGAIYSIPATDYREQIIEDLEEIGIYITSTIHNLTDLLTRLDKIIVERFDETTPVNSPQLPDSDNQTSAANSDQIKLTHAEIATLYHINHWPITSNNNDEVAHKYGQTSGQRLETEYKNLTSELARTAKGKYRIANYNHILPLVLPEYKAQYDKELRSAIANNKK